MLSPWSSETADRYLRKLGRDGLRRALDRRAELGALSCSCFAFCSLAGNLSLPSKVRSRRCDFINSHARCHATGAKLGTLLDEAIDSGRQIN